jgi:hypothetical protein
MKEQFLSLLLRSSIGYTVNNVQIGDQKLEQCLINHEGSQKLTI